MSSLQEYFVLQNPEATEGNLSSGRIGNLLIKIPSVQIPDVIAVLCAPAVHACTASRQELTTPETLCYLAKAALRIDGC